MSGPKRVRELRFFCFVAFRIFLEGGERNKLGVIHKRMNAGQMEVENFNIEQGSYAGARNLKWVAV